MRYDLFGERVDGQHVQPAAMVDIDREAFDVSVSPPIKWLMIAIVWMKNLLPSRIVRNNGVQNGVQVHGDR